MTVTDQTPCRYCRQPLADHPHDLDGTVLCDDTATYYQPDNEGAH